MLGVKVNLNCFFAFLRNSLSFSLAARSVIHFLDAYSYLVHMEQGRLNEASHALCESAELCESDDDYVFKLLQKLEFLQLDLDDLRILVCNEYATTESKAPRTGHPALAGDLVVFPKGSPPVSVNQARYFGFQLWASKVDSGSPVEGTLGPTNTHESTLFNQYIVFRMMRREFDQ